MSRIDDAPKVQPEDRAALREWLMANHATATGAWVVTYKRSSGNAHLSYEDVVLELLCFGWVDSTHRTVDAERTALYVAPRKKGSTWASTNKARVERLSADGLMQPAGVDAVRSAKADGSWTLLDAVEALEVPDDLATALRRHPAASQRYQALSPSAKKQVLWSVVNAKRPETRAARIHRFVDPD